jgi:hypothetical protein
MWENIYVAVCIYVDVVACGGAEGRNKLVGKESKMSQLTAARVPVGFRFHPTDEELVGYYLPKKVGAIKIDLDLIRDLDLYKLEPWDLQGQQPKLFLAKQYMHPGSSCVGYSADHPDRPKRNKK